MQIEVEFRDHPARDVAKDPRTGQPLLDEKTGQPIRFPMFPDQRSIWVGGRMVGYCGTGAGRPISLIARQPEAFCEAIRAAVEDRFGKPSGLSQPPPPRVTEDDNDDDQ